MTRRPLAVCAMAIAAVLLVPVAAVGQSSTAPSDSDEPVVFTEGVTGDLNSANPFKQIDSSESFVSSLMYDGLFRLGQKDYATEPELATEVPTQENGGISSDGLTWTFHLRKGLTWSDGVPLTAHDFVWTADFIMANDISAWSDGYRFTDSIRATDDTRSCGRRRAPRSCPDSPATA